MGVITYPCQHDKFLIGSMGLNNAATFFDLCHRRLLDPWHVWCGLDRHLLGKSQNQSHPILEDIGRRERAPIVSL